MSFISKIINYLGSFSSTIINNSNVNTTQYSNIVKTLETEAVPVKGKFKKGISSLFENYKAARRLILLFIVSVNGYLVYITANQYILTNKVDSNWVSIVEIYSAILVIVTCYYLHLRSKEITTSNGTVIKNEVDSIIQNSNNNE